MVDKGVASVIVTREKLRTHAAAEVAIDAREVHVKGSGGVSRMLLSSVCHIPGRIARVYCCYKFINIIN